MVKMKVYIEDVTVSEIVINGVSCRRIGDLGNGEQKTFQIGDESLRASVIADKLSSKMGCDRRVYRRIN